MLSYYKHLLGYPNDELFFNKYLSDPALQRLKGVGYFCGMDFASKDIYNFSEYISRYDHSLTVALIVYKLTQNKAMTIAGLYHDIATPCFSHVIDYMNKDYVGQNSTEIHTEKIIRDDIFLQELLKQDGINVEDIVNFKKFGVVDNDRPRLCADRLDAIILNSIAWLKNISPSDIEIIINDLIIIDNEIGFSSIEVAKKALWHNDEINKEMHTDYDIYMMQLLANIVRCSLTHNYINEMHLYSLSEEQLLTLFNNIDDSYLKDQLLKFRSIKLSEIPSSKNILIKNRYLAPMTKLSRIYTI